MLGKLLTQLVILLLPSLLLLQLQLPLLGPKGGRGYLLLGLDHCTAGELSTDMVLALSPWEIL
jgi:hypothetical protein